jgi:aryl-alcohol dehydrogenase-like predicted oxidoreductase
MAAHGTVKLEFSMRYLDVGAVRKISQVGLGTWQFGSKEWSYGARYDEYEAARIVRRALELGVTFFDTAELYGTGQSERILGRALGADRESVFLATKVYPVFPPPLLLRQRAAASASRLRASRLDLYQLHWPNPLGDASVMRGMRSLQRDGAVGEVGVSNYSLARWRAAEQALGSRVLSNQVEYHLLARSAEADLLPFAQARGRLIVAHSPLARGLLAGTYHRENLPANPVRTSSALFDPQNLDRISGLLNVLREVARAHSATSAQIALAWVIRHPAVVAIPGASSVEQLEANVAAGEIGLSDDEVDALDVASANVRLVAEPGRSNLPRALHLVRSAQGLMAASRRAVSMVRAERAAQRDGCTTGGRAGGAGYA